MKCRCSNISLLFGYLFKQTLRSGAISDLWPFLFVGGSTDYLSVIHGSNLCLRLFLIGGREEFSNGNGRVEFCVEEA